MGAKICLSRGILPIICFVPIIVPCGARHVHERCRSGKETGALSSAGPRQHGKLPTHFKSCSLTGLSKVLPITRLDAAPVCALWLPALLEVCLGQLLKEKGLLVPSPVARSGGYDLGVCFCRCPSPQKNKHKPIIVFLLSFFFLI